MDFHRPTTTTAPSSDFDFAFAFDDTPDPETTHLLPPPTPKRHTVRVQGQLVLVKSVSVNNLAPAPPSPGLGAGERPVSVVPGPGLGQGSGRTGVYETALGGARGRRMSFTGTFGKGEGQGQRGMADETDEERRARKGRDGQLRGYGIGGRGNIRRATEVAPFGGKRSGGRASAPTTPMEGTFPKKGWNLREKLGLGVPQARRD
ncbi:hypothetical protein B0T18DRAFT_446139 [Schizothecium vesticola]|uniref:Uncharacterized protein n=1 Tax=Schizothecium vesticola TaxID=314040 RepID=A0AA40K9A1_9PEZI|nr:hypothetical protein B0T18DRAFT_446139 [Schizothecium vesticola]